MKKYAALLLILLCLLPSCGSTNEEPAPDVQIFFSDTSFTPLQHWIYSLHKGVAADGLRLNAEDMLMLSADSGVVSAPFTIDTGSARKGGVYTLYRVSDSSEVYGRNASFEVPEAPGEYLCVVELSFGTDEHYAGYQLYFRFSIE